MIYYLMFKNIYEGWVNSMKNYYDQKCELHIAKLRLKSLNRKKDLYFNLTQPQGISYDKELVMGGQVKNRFDVYMEKVEEINIQIKIVEAEIIILEENLKDMEKALRSMKGSLERIFVLRYIDGFSINTICKRTHYSKSEVYRKLDIIKKILKTGKNGNNYML